MIQTLPMGLVNRENPKLLYRRSACNNPIRIDIQQYNHLFYIRDDALSIIAQCHYCHSVQQQQQQQPEYHNQLKDDDPNNYHNIHVNHIQQHEQQQKGYCCFCGVATDVVNILDRMLSLKVPTATTTTTTTVPNNKRYFEFCSYTGPCSLEGYAGRYSIHELYGDTKNEHIIKKNTKKNNNNNNNKRKKIQKQDNNQINISSKTNSTSEIQRIQTNEIICIEEAKKKQQQQQQQFYVRLDNDQPKMDDNDQRTNNMHDDDNKNNNNDDTMSNSNNDDKLRQKQEDPPSNNNQLLLINHLNEYTKSLEQIRLPSVIGNTSSTITNSTKSNTGVNSQKVQRIRDILLPIFQSSHQQQQQQLLLSSSLSKREKQQRLLQDDDNNDTTTIDPIKRLRLLLINSSNDKGRAILNHNDIRNIQKQNNRVTFENNVTVHNNKNDLSATTVDNKDDDDIGKDDNSGSSNNKYDIGKKNPNIPNYEIQIPNNLSKQLRASIQNAIHSILSRDPSQLLLLQSSSVPKNKDTMQGSTEDTQQDSKHQQDDLDLVVLNNSSQKQGSKDKQIDTSSDLIKANDDDDDDDGMVSTIIGGTSRTSHNTHTTTVTGQGRYALQALLNEATKKQQQQMRPTEVVVVQDAGIEGQKSLVKQQQRGRSSLFQEKRNVGDFFLSISSDEDNANVGNRGLRKRKVNTRSKRSGVRKNSIIGKKDDDDEHKYSDLSSEDDDDDEISVAVGQTALQQLLTLACRQSANALSRDESKDHTYPLIGTNDLQPRQTTLLSNDREVKLDNKKAIKNPPKKGSKRKKQIQRRSITDSKRHRSHENAANDSSIDDRKQPARQSLDTNVGFDDASSSESFLSHYSEAIMTKNAQLKENKAANSAETELITEAQKGDGIGPYTENDDDDGYSTSSKDTLDASESSSSRSDASDQGRHALDILLGWMP